MTEPHTAPTSLRSLTARLDNLARKSARPLRRVQRTVANTVVGQMLPSGVMKGGAAISMRVGEAASRFTTDLDAARHTDLTLDDYLNELARRLDAGWGGFTGTLEQLPPAEPEGVAEQYVMQPFKTGSCISGGIGSPFRSKWDTTRSAAPSSTNSESRTIS